MNKTLSTGQPERKRGWHRKAVRAPCMQMQPMHQAAFLAVVPEVWLVVQYYKAWSDSWNQCTCAAAAWPAHRHFLALFIAVALDDLGNGSSNIRRRRQLLLGISQHRFHDVAQQLSGKKPPGTLLPPQNVVRLQLPLQCLRLVTLAAPTHCSASAL
jgi:hypothetical protein